LAFQEPSLFGSVFTAGFPPVPFSREPVLVAQRGEVTVPDLTTYDHRRLFLYSAVARLGNSGGPVLSLSGHVIGLVSDSLHHQSQPNSTGFYAGIPTAQILVAVHELVPQIELLIENYE
jgi:S1-C subfamily serine protease